MEPASDSEGVEGVDSLQYPVRDEVFSVCQLWSSFLALSPYLLPVGCQPSYRFLFSLALPLPDNDDCDDHT